MMSARSSRAVAMITGSSVREKRSRMRRSTAKPSRPGIITSRITAWKVSRSIAASASAPLSAWTVPWPRTESCSARISRFRGLSSTIKIKVLPESQDLIRHRPGRGPPLLPHQEARGGEIDGHVAAVVAAFELADAVADLISRRDLVLLDLDRPVLVRHLPQVEEGLHHLV